jgi:hypothetical protein
MDGEVASALSRLVRMRQITADDAAVRFSDFEIWHAATSSLVEVHAAGARLAYACVRRFDLARRLVIGVDPTSPKSPRPGERWRNEARQMPAARRWA